MRRTVLAATAAALLLVAACSDDADVAVPSTVAPPGSELVTDASTPVTDSIDSDPAMESTGVEPQGFTTAIVEITKADGTVCEVCMWLADTADERGQGLMGVTSLGTPEGMAFVWDEPTAGSFFMFRTVTPLSIAWFGPPDDAADDAADGAADGTAGGALVSMADMEPCVAENSAACERFGSGGDYVLAVEVFQGDLASIGITEGASARLLADTESADCPRT